MAEEAQSTPRGIRLELPAGRQAGREVVPRHGGVELHGAAPQCHRTTGGISPSGGLYATALCVALTRLRRDVEATFPGARDFIRPGFDTGEVASA